MQNSDGVLVCDDNYSFRWSLALWFQRRGIDVDIAENGLEAVTMLRRKHYSCAILDLNMPKLAGPAVLEIIENELAAQPVLVVTAFPELAESFTSVRNVCGMLVKPVDVETVYDTVMRIRARA
jgi:DNA-binding NtrC family response regulator